MLQPREVTAPWPFLERPYVESHPRFSADGRWLAYMSNVSGRNEVYVRPYPGPGPRYQISTNGGGDPVWSKSGTELFYHEPPEKWMSVDVQAEPGWRAGKPTLLFEGPYDSHYDVASDGRFVMIRAEPWAPITELRLVQNWFEELKARVPVN